LGGRAGGPDVEIRYVDGIAHVRILSRSNHEKIGSYVRDTRPSGPLKTLHLLSGGAASSFELSAESKQAESN
jgi:hypothetical protein